MPEKIKILIADDHIVFRQGTRALLEQEPDLEVVGEAGDGEEAVNLAIELNPDVAIIDIAMPVVDGIAATKRIKEECPDINVLILSAYDDDQFVFRLLKAGAAGYLLKSVPSSELITAIRAVKAGDSILHPAIARKVLSRFVPSSDRPKEHVKPGVLNQREVDLLTLVARGASNKEIANEFNVSVRTVQSHLRHIFRKLGVNSRTEAVVYALREKWINLEDAPRVKNIT
ncbi:MAG: response regulator transcription factor [Dehalococcoidia bacterium]